MRPVADLVVVLHEAQEAAGRPVLQHVPPPGVLAGADGHVIGHDVQQMPQALGAQGSTQAGVCRLAADLGVDMMRVDHVVAVRAPGRGLQRGGGVEMADAQRAQIVGNGRRVVQAKAGMELQAIGGAPIDRRL